MGCEDCILFYYVPGAIRRPERVAVVVVSPAAAFTGPLKTAFPLTVRPSRSVWPETCRPCCTVSPAFAEIRPLLTRKLEMTALVVVSPTVVTVLDVKAVIWAESTVSSPPIDKSPGKATSPVTTRPPNALNSPLKMAGPVATVIPSFTRRPCCKSANPVVTVKSSLTMTGALETRESETTRESTVADDDVRVVASRVPIVAAVFVFMYVCVCLYINVSK